MGDPLYRLVAERFPRFKLENHRGGRRLFVLLEERFFRKGQVHARPFHFVELQNRPCQLALEGPPIIHFLDEIGHAEVRPVEYLVADDARLGKAVAGERKPELVDLLPWNKDGFAGIVKPVGDAFFLQFVNDLCGILGVQVVEERRIRRLVDERDHGDNRSDDTESDDHEKDLLPQGGLPEEPRNLLLRA